LITTAAVKFEVKQSYPSGRSQTVRCCRSATDHSDNGRLAAAEVQGNDNGNDNDNDHDQNGSIYAACHFDEVCTSLTPCYIMSFRELEPIQIWLLYVRKIPQSSSHEPFSIFWEKKEKIDWGNRASFLGPTRLRPKEARA